ncbi:unnamed protein product [Linum trigynum]|uniref:Uncharacterized protein n=1 Tax=Linum trigynum TaxID=586398 RepID=A0AAV2E4Y2_9ROSI
MAGIIPHVPLHLAQAAIFTGRGFNSAEDYNRYLLKFQDRPLCPSVSLDPARFNRYDMNIPGPINVVGWSNLPLDHCYGFHPEAVCMFYANMRPCFNTDPPTFTTTVYNYLLTISVDLLSYLLGYPINGAEVVDEADFPTVEFNEAEALHLYVRDIGAYHPTRLEARHLRYKVARVNLIDTLRAQFVLRKVDALVGHPPPRVNASGGMTVGFFVPADVAEGGPEEGLSLADLVEGIPENEEAMPENEEAMSDILDYLSSPSYPF